MTGLDIDEVPEGLGDMIVPKIPGDLVTSVEFPPWCCHLKNCLTCQAAEEDENEESA